MNINEDFDYDRFMSLRSSELVNYAEPFFDTARPFSIRVANRLFDDLQKYDELHLIYAIELIARRFPGMIAQRLPQYLVHELGSVRCAADRALINLPSEYITNNLVESVRSALTKYPESYFPKVNFFARIVDMLVNRMANEQTTE